MTIDPDTEALVREEMRRTGLSFKEILNSGLRKAIRRPGKSRVAVAPLFPAPFPREFQTGSFNRLADELDDEATLRELGA